MPETLRKRNFLPDQRSYIPKRKRQNPLLFSLCVLPVLGPEANTDVGEHSRAGEIKSQLSGVSTEKKSPQGPEHIKKSRRESNLENQSHKVVDKPLGSLPSYT